MTFEGEETKTEYYNGNGKDILILNRRPVNSITSIKYVGDSVGSNLSNCVELISSEGILKAKHNYAEGIYYPLFWKGEKNIIITYTYGYIDYPVDIARAIKLLVCAKALNIIGSRTGGGSISVQSHSRNYGSHGKYTDIRKELIGMAYSLIRDYASSIIGG